MAIDVDGVVPENAEELIGREFVHFKGGHYRLRGIATYTETREPMVVYEALYGDGGLWVRPAKMFFGTTVRDGKTLTRFTLLDPSRTQGAPAAK